MREINFRAWYAEKQKMYAVAKVDMWGDPDQATCDLAAIDEELFDIYLNEVETMQYIGVKDKYGREIYEGDIVKWWGYEVQFGRQIRPERIICINDYIKDTYAILCITENTGQTVEVIGNIYEDKHLLEAK